MMPILFMKVHYRKQADGTIIGEWWWWCWLEEEEEEEEE